MNPLSAVANNAGGIFGERTKTVDGFEKTFQVNHLAPFLLTTLLLDKLVAGHASVIQSSSIAARMYGDLNLDDLEHDKGFTPQPAYGTAKLENILFIKELHRRYHADGLSTAAFHLGAVASSFAADSNSFLKRIYNNRVGRAFMASPAKGADQLVWLAESTPAIDWESGRYSEKRKPAKRNNHQTSDLDLARDLWDRSVQIISHQPQ